MKHRPAIMMAFTLVGVAVLFLFNILIGTVTIPLRAVTDILLGLDTTGYDATEVTIWSNIIWNSRFPQTLTALLAGAGLAAWMNWLT